MTKTQKKSGDYEPLTIHQRPNLDGFPVAAEILEMRPSGNLSLQDGRIFNLLVENAVGCMHLDMEHEISVSKLRGLSHKGSERVRDSVKSLMTTLVEVESKDKKTGLATMKMAQLLIETEIMIDEDDPRAVLRYNFTPTIREIVKNSKKWGRLKGFLLFPFQSKYGHKLYERLSAKINLKKDHEFFTPTQFREFMDVPNDTLSAYTHLRQRCIEPAVLEVNGLTDLMVEISTIREDGKPRGRIKGYEVRWWKKEKDEWFKTLEEISRPKVGRQERLKGTVQKLID